MTMVTAALFFTLAGGAANAESFGIKFLGNTTDMVTNSAGVVPISGWTNIANTTFTSGTIRSSDGAVLALLTMSGSGRANGWNSGTGADGGDGSLMRGYCDAKGNSPVTVTISGLTTNACYTIYLYTQGDGQRPGSGTDWIPNYTINGSTIYTPTIAPSFKRFIQGGMTLADTNTYPITLMYGNYIRWNNGIASNGVITISANTDNHTYRSPLNGIELVLNTNPPTSQTRQIRIEPLGDSITWGYPTADTVGGYRLTLYQMLSNASIAIDFVGTQVSTAPGLLYPNHEGHSGYRIDQIDDPYFLGWVNQVASPDIILLLIGTNDMGQNYDPTNAIVRLDAMISHLTTDRPNAKVIVANLLPRSDTTFNGWINTLFNPFVPGVVAKHQTNGEPVYFWDMHSQIVVSDTDGLHPTTNGYPKIGKQWFDAINAVYAPFTGYNLALNKSTTSSSTNGSNVASNAVDGDVSTYWSSAVSDPQWLDVDLGSIQNVYQVKCIWTAAYAKSFQIQVSTNNTNWTSVYNTTTGSGGTNSVTFEPTGARFVRIYGTAQGAGSGYGIYELQAFAAPPVNLALNKSAAASSTSDAVNFPVTNAVDGNASSHWSSTAHDTEWITVDLGSAQRVGRVRLNWDAAYGQSYDLLSSTDNVNWTRVYNSSQGIGGTDDISFVAVNARYVKMNGLQRGTTNGYSLNEFAIYGALDAPAASQFSPQIAANPAWVPSSVYPGQSASATVTVSGTTQFAYRWKAGLNGNYTNLTDGGTISGATNATLTITGVQPTNALNYVVVITNSLGSITSSVATLVVLPTSPATNFTLNYGGSPIAESAGNDWNNVNVWNPIGLSAATSAFAYPGSSFELVVGSRLRNPAATTYNVFPGASLIVDGGGVFENGTVGKVSEIRFKNSAAGSQLTGGFYTTNYFPNLVLNGGQLNIGDNTTVVLQGQVTVATNSVIYNSGSGTNQAYQIDAYLTGSGKLQFYNYDATNLDLVNSVLSITGTANTFTGQWDIEMGALVGNDLNSLGTNTITINTNGVLETSYPINNPNASLILKGRMFLTQTDAFNSVVINGTSLPPGTYSAAQLHATNATVFPLSFPTLYGTTATSAAGAIKVGNVAVLPSSPHLTSIQVSGSGGLALSATNGTPGGFWALLQSTNVALPVSQWQTNTAGTFDNSGNLSTNLTSAVTNLQEFYILKVQ